MVCEGAGVRRCGGILGHIVGLFLLLILELYLEEHCLKAPGLLREGGVGEDIIHAVVSHGYGITVGGVRAGCGPEHEMEKVLLQQMS